MRRLRKVIKRWPVAYWFHSGTSHISLGFHIDWYQPNIEIHLPFGFFRIGWSTLEVPYTQEELASFKSYGYDGREKALMKEPQPKP